MLWGDEVTGPVCPDCGALMIDEDTGVEVDTHECELTAEGDPDGDGVSEEAEDDGLDQFDDGEAEEDEEAQEEIEEETLADDDADGLDEQNDDGW
jgi:hypothetical protein